MFYSILFLDISLQTPRCRHGFLRHGDTSTDGSSTGDTSFGDNSFSLSRHSDNATRRSEKGSDVAWILISRWPSLNRRTQPFKPGFETRIQLGIKLPNPLPLPHLWLASSKPTLISVHYCKLNCFAFLLINITRQ